MTKIEIEIPDGGEVDELHVKVGNAVYHASRITPGVDVRHVLTHAWWSLSRHGGERGFECFPLDVGMRTLEDAMAAIQRDLAHGAGISALVTWVCDLVDAGRSRSDERAARKHAIAVAVACQ